MRILIVIMFIYVCIITDIYITTKQHEQKVIEFTNYIYIPNGIEKCETRCVVTYDFITFLKYCENE